jgi:hypothetical protein
LKIEALISKVNRVSRSRKVRSLPEDVRAFTHNNLSLRALYGDFLPFDLSSINRGANLCCQIFDREPGPTGEVMSMTRVDIIDGYCQVFARDGVVRDLELTG